LKNPPKLAALIGPIILMLSACTSLVSGNRAIAVAPSDAGSIADVKHLLFAPNIVATYSADHPVIILEFAFDGTLNDQSRIPSDERATVVSYITRRIHVPEINYHPGAGMHGQSIDWTDAALGKSIFNVANDAMGQFYDESAPFLRDHPNGEIRVFVTGFSRGAATARQFMNITDDAWHQKYHDSATGSAPKLRFYALLYDTVSTGLNGAPALRLGLPRDLNYSMHFVARDEHRKLYKVDIDSPDQGGPTTEEGINRINTVYLPGAHSDIGTSYLNGIGDEYRQIADYSLSMLGLISEKCLEAHSDATLLGKHDSRGWLDILTRTPAPNSESSRPRAHLDVFPAPLTPEEVNDIRSSNEALFAFNSTHPIQVITERMETFGFTAMRDGKGLKLISYPDNLVHPGAALQPTMDGGAKFTFSFQFTPWFKTNILFSPKVVRNIRPTGSTVDVTYLNVTNDLQRFTIFVDAVIVEQQDWHRSGPTEQFSPGFVCPATSLPVVTRGSSAG
jgi:hypothetical protein